MPKLKELLEHPPSARGGAEAQIAEMRNYLYRIVEELQYLLTHLESDNTNSTLWDDIDSQIPKAGTATPLMDGVGSAGSSPRWSRENHRHPADTSKADVTALAQAKAVLEDAIEAEADAREDHEADTDNPHEVTKAQVGLGNVENERQYSAQNPPPIPTPAEVGAIPATDKGSAGGVAELDANGMVPSAQLPSYVDDVLEYASLSAFPVTGESGKIYVALDTGRTYRWSGSAYVEISESLALGETSSTAYRGDRGKIAYDHSQLASGNPHNVTAAEAGAVPVTREINGHALSSDITLDATDVGARADDWMPTAADVGARPDTWTPSAADVGAVPDAREVNGHALSADITLDASDVGARPDDWVPDADDVPYDNTQSGLMATDVQAAIDEIAQGGGGGSAASAVSYDNTGSGMSATNVQDAIDEVLGDIPTTPGDIGAQPAITANGILKGDGLGGVTSAWTNVDYVGLSAIAYYENDITATHSYDVGDFFFIVGYLCKALVPINVGDQFAIGTYTVVSLGDQIADKVGQNQIAVVENGTTASRAYLPGERFVWNGILYRAKTAIASGDTFTPGTNCASTTVAAELGIPCEWIVPAAAQELLSSISGSVYRVGNVVVFALQANTSGALTSNTEILRIPNHAPSINGQVYTLFTGNTVATGRINGGTISSVSYARFFPNATVSTGVKVTISGSYFIS